MHVQLMQLFYSLEVLGPQILINGPHTPVDTVSHGYFEVAEEDQ